MAATFLADRCWDFGRFQHISSPAPVWSG